MMSDRCTVINFVHNKCCILDTDNETVYSIWNDLQRSLKVIGNIILRSIAGTVFPSDTGKASYTYFQTKIAKKILKVDQGHCQW